ncbi:MULTISPECIES: Lnb N-terminal periplasmic domain-containing protein [unclassified Nitrospina]|uniref:Lnb N-terminal periplasmic domain-containing protein n=1 Tax=unclassified Nitrospina TaxID=2638683 RepID=UPI003F9E3D9B
MNKDAGFRVIRSRHSFIFPALTLTLSLFIRFAVFLAFAGFLSIETAQAQPEGPAYAWELIDRARSLNLSEERRWRLLGHYRTNWWGHLESEADAPEFFLSPEGKTDPQKELDATLIAFFQKQADVPEGVMHPQCRFPARYKWLNERLNFDPARLSDQPCSRLERWIGRLDPEKITLVFASYYMNNPSSMFGHTLLRIDSHSRGRYKKLLNYGVNYAANPDTDNPVLYAIKGVGGFFSGTFTVFPYSIKVQEYNNWESRDLWEYELNLTAEQMDYLLRHLWELGNIEFDYYYFQENCSYHMLTVLETANPEWRLTDGFVFSVIPGDTIKALVEQPGLVNSVFYRPAILSKMNHKIEQMESGERRVLYALADDKSALKEKPYGALTVPQKALVLDAYLDYLEYLYVQDRAVNPMAPIRIPQEILLERARLNHQRGDSQVTRFSSPPEEGHGTDRFRLATGLNDSELFQEVGYRPALHDLLADETGYDRHSQILMMDGLYRYYHESQRWRVERFQLLDIITLTPFEPIFKRPSWRVNLGFERVRDFDCEYCLAFGGTTGVGLTYEPGHDSPFLLFAMLEADAETSGSFDDNFRLGGGGTGGAFYTLNRDWRVFVGGEYKRFPMGHDSEVIEWTAQGRYRASQNVDVRLEYRRTGHTDEGVLSLNLYF